MPKAGVGRQRCRPTPAFAIRYLATDEWPEKWE